MSPDGLPLAVYPPGEEEAAAAVWSRLVALGPVSRGFVTVRSEVWAFVQGERYGALVLADRSVRPGQVLELVDQVLAEASAAAVIAGGADRRLDSGQRDARERANAGRRFNAPLHPDERQPEPGLEPVVAQKVATIERDPPAPVPQASAAPPAPAPPEASAGPHEDDVAERDRANAAARIAEVEAALIAAVEAAGAAPLSDPADGKVTTENVRDRQPEGPAAVAPAVDTTDAPTDAPTGPSETPPPAETPPPVRPPASGAVDIIALAREFAGLLSERDDGPKT